MSPPPHPLVPIIHLSIRAAAAVTSRVKVISMVHLTFRALLTTGLSCHPVEMQIHSPMVIHLAPFYLLCLNILQVKETTMHLIHLHPLSCILLARVEATRHHWTLGIKIPSLMPSIHMHRLLSIHMIHLTRCTMQRMTVILYVILLTTHEGIVKIIILKVMLLRLSLHQSLRSGLHRTFMASCYRREFPQLIIFMKIMDEILILL